MRRIYHDVSLVLSPSIAVYPGDPPLRIAEHLLISRGDPANVSILEMGSHTGTHVDAPRHFFDDGAPVDQLSLDHFLGKAKVLDLTGVDAIGAADLARHTIEPEDRVLLKTRNSAFVEEPNVRTDFAYLTLDGARYLAEVGIRTLGIDYLSIERFDCDDFPAHRTLLGRGIVLIEGLCLGRVAPGEYEMIALPIKIRGGNGSPVRVVLIEERPDFSAA
jgi:arylformamidase